MDTGCDMYLFALGGDGEALCVKDFGDWVEGACCEECTCPTNADLEDLLPLFKCFVQEPSRIRKEDGDAALNSFDPYNCLLENDPTSDGTKPESCETSSALSKYRACEQETTVVFAELVGQDAALQCEDVLIGPLSYACKVKFGEAVERFCTPKPWYLVSVGGMPIIGLVGLLVGLGGIVGVLIYRCHKQNQQKMLKLSSGNGQLQGYEGRGQGPPMASLFPQMGGQGIMGGNMMKQNSFMQQPHQSAYSASPMPNLQQVAAATLDPKTLDLRKHQLVDFYAFHDPSREDIEGHVDNLFAKYNFQNLSSAVKNKYGVLPPGWEQG